MTTLTVGTGKTYPDVATALAAVPATLVANIIIEVWQTTSSANEYVSGSTISMSGFTVGAFTLTLQPASGLAWNDQATPVTRYDTTKGIALRCTAGFQNGVVAIGQGSTYIKNLQLSGNTGTLYSIVHMPNAAGIVDSCIISDSGATQSSGTHIGNGGGQVITNNLFILNPSTTLHGALFGTYVTTITVLGNTCIVPTDGAQFGTGNAAEFGAHYYSGTFEDNGFFGFAGIFSVAPGGGTNDYNASNIANSVGTHNQASLTISSEITNGAAATLDLRPKGGNHLAGNGIANGTITLDAFKATRASPPAIGAIEPVGGAAFIAKSFMIKRAINRAAVW